MTRHITIALDAMGGDVGPDVVLPAAIEAQRHRGALRLLLVGQPDVLRERLAALGCSENDHLLIYPATQVVAMDEPPAQALRTKKDSSMRVAIDLVRRGEADACVSAGNTGALMAIARFVLKTLPGIDRPAICTALPSLYGSTHVLDLGANVDSSAEHLLQFALMGSVLVSALENLDRPRVGLLNVGSEDIKGNEQVKSAAQLLAGSSLNYVGYVEGNDIFMGDIDVVVCDGFVGNVALKSTEGVAKLLSRFLRREFERSWYTRLAALIARPVLQAFRAQADPRHYNGATLLGLQGVVVKSHGGADAVAFANAIRIAILEVDKNVPMRLRERMAPLSDTEATAR